VKYGILRAVTMKITVFWEAASCSLLYCTYINIQWNVLLHFQGKGAYQVTCHNSVTFCDIHYQENCKITHSPNISILCHLTSLVIAATNKGIYRKRLIQGTGNLLKIRCGSVIHIQSASVIFHVCCKTLQ
jgi:hypothetical protein